jgi:uncharacterized membrane protein
MRGEEMRVLRIAARTIAAALLVAGLTVPFGTALAQSKQPLNFKSVDVDLPGVTLTQAIGINGEGDIVGRYRVGSVSHGFLLSEGTLTTIDYPAGISGTTQAQGINSEGEVVGLYTDHGTIVRGDAFRTRAFLRDASGNFTALDFPDAENTFAIKVSPTGQVVGCYHHQDSDFAVSGGGTMHGYVFQNGEYKSFSSVAGTMHNGITQHGQIIVGVWYPTPTEFHAYKVEGEDYALLDLPSYVMWSDARDINRSGEIVGFFIDSANKTHGFLLRKGEFTTIDFPGEDVISTQARGINPQGDIVGFYVSKDAAGKLHTHGFVATRNRDQNEDK